jgi:hypothetical protein
MTMPAKPSMPAWAKGTLVLVVTFAAGLAAGLSYNRHRPPEHRPPGNAAEHLTQRLHEELALDSAQQAAVAAIFARRQSVVDSTWHVMRPLVHATLDSTLREVAGVLRPEQLARYREMMGRMHPGALR